MFIEKLTDKEIISFLKDVYKNKISEKELNRYKFKMDKLFLSPNEEDCSLYLRIKIGVKNFDCIIKDYDFINFYDNDELDLTKYFIFMKNKFGEEYINKLNLYYQKEDKQNNEELIK